MKKTAIIISLFTSFSSFSQKVITKSIEPSILRKIVSDDAILDKAFQFEDKNGKNYFVATTLQNRSDEWASKGILIQQYIEKPNKELELLRQITDYENHCEFDNDLQFLTESLTISDLDKNKYAEITFLYKVGCRSDVSPITLKLMVIENGNKAAIRGKTMPRGFDFPKEKVADSSFNKLPKPIQDQANKIWDKFAPEF